MKLWHRPALVLLVALLVLGLSGGLVRFGPGDFGVVAQETPMSAAPVPGDDEPEPQPEPQQPLQPGATPPVLNVEPGRRLPTVDVPLPPARPFALSPPANGGPPANAAPAASASAPGQATAPAAPAAPAAPEPPAAATPPAIANVPDEPEIELSPNMRITSLPVVTQPSTTEEIEAEEERTPEPTVVEKQTDAVDIACLQPALLKLVQQAGEHFGATPVITSGQRQRGRRNSYHRRCMAADFFVPGIERARLAKYLRALPGAGGVGTYCHTKSVHIDIGEPRNWWQCGFRTRFAQRN